MMYSAEKLNKQGDNIESEEELKSFLMKVKEESEKADLKPYIQKTKRSWYLVPSLMANKRGNNENSDRL